MFFFIFIGTAQRKNGRRTDLGGDQSRLKIFTYVHRVPGGENMGDIFLLISWYNLKIISPAKLLVEKSLTTGSSESPNERNATVDLQLLQVYFKFLFVKTLTYSL